MKTSLFLLCCGLLAKELFPDALHPSQEGYLIWRDSARPVLAELIKVPEPGGRTQ